MIKQEKPYMYEAYRARINNKFNVARNGLDHEIYISAGKNGIYAALTFTIDEAKALVEALNEALESQREEM